MTRYLKDAPELTASLEDVRIVYTDLDGTLLGKGGTLLIDGQGMPSTRTAETIVAANKAGLPIIPVSGRSRIQLTEIVRMCGWTDFIAEAGAIRTYYDGREREIIYDIPEWKFKLKHGQTPLDIIRESGALELLEETFPGQIEHHAPWHENRETTDVLRGFVNRQKALEVLETIALPLSFIDNGVIHPKMHTLKQSDEPIRAYHLTPAGVSKRRAIALDLERRKIDPQKAIMIGDGPSDMLCAEVVGASFLVENALLSPGLDKRIDTIPNAAIVHGIAGDGWSNVISEILLRGSF
ncbi:MAG: HAD family phosphatase [Coriobacteriia bacterium]|nr:HAD family phosphatase [Coriobacteriia bacterium]